MQRRARTKAMFRLRSSDEVMSLCRSFCKQPHKRWLRRHNGLTKTFSCDSQWSTVWFLGSSLTSHPLLSTLPTHLQQIGNVGILVILDFFKSCRWTWNICLTFHCLSFRQLLRVHRQICTTQRQWGRYIDQRQRTSRQIVCKTSKNIYWGWKCFLYKQFSRGKQSCSTRCIAAKHPVNVKVQDERCQLHCFKTSFYF